MLSLLPTSFGTLSTGTNATVSSLIREMKVSKYDVSQIINRLNNIQVPADFAASRVAPGSVLDRQIVVDLFRESAARIKLLFATGNGIATALGSMIEIFSSEIDKVEKDLNNLKLFIDNYEFLSGKDDFYNSSYIEKFDNLQGDYRSDNVLFQIPDRNGSSFPLNGNGFIDSFTGTFKVGKNYTNVNVVDNISDIKISTNYSSYATSESNFENLFNYDIQKSWNVTIKSPSILSSSLGEYSKYINYDLANLKGAETIAEVSFNSPVEMDTIRIRPNTSNGLQLLQIVAFNADLDSQESIANQADYKLLLKDADLVKGNHEVSFNKMQVSKLIFIFSQKSYVRNKMQAIPSEVNSKLVQRFVNLRSLERRTEFSVNQDIVLFYFSKRNSINALLKNRNQNKNYYSYAFPAKMDTLANSVRNKIAMVDNYDVSEVSNLDLSKGFQNIINSISFSLDRTNSFMKPITNVGLSNSSTGSTSVSGISGSVRVSDGAINDYRLQSANPPILFASRRDSLDLSYQQENNNSYEYIFSIRSIEFLNTVLDSGPVSRACFVTKKIDTNGQPLAVKVKLDATTSSAQNFDNELDIDSLSSYELSISNVDNPTQESDWIPILPFNSSSVSSEVVFFNKADYQYKTRFRAIAGSMLLYKDGKLCDRNSYLFNEQNSSIKLDGDVYNESSIFTVSYNLDLSNYNPYELDFVKSNIYKDSVKVYSSSYGSGQRFLRTDQNNSVQLEYVPFLNEAYRRSSTYNSTVGTIFHGSGSGYSPVRVRLNDGTYAINLTNYTESPNSVNFYSSATPLFYVNGTKLVFDRLIDSTFFVEYSYIPNSVRLRAIVRRNVSGVSIPDKIDTIIAKFKTINYDPYYDKLNFLSRIEI